MCLSASLLWSPFIRSLKSLSVSLLVCVGEKQVQRMALLPS